MFFIHAKKLHSLITRASLEEQERMELDYDLCNFQVSFTSVGAGSS